MEKKVKSVLYGLGGWDETKPDENIVEIIYYTDEELAALEIPETNGESSSQI